MTDTLLQRVAGGDTQAMRECIDRYGGLVWSLARRTNPTETEAEDAVQDIFIDIWRSAGRFDPAVASETTFVAMIARRRLIDRRRRAGREPGREPIGDPEAAAGDGHAPREDVREEASLASRALESLSPEQQRVLRLSIFQGLSHERIARATGIPLGTVKTHARRGLLRVREILARHGRTPTQ